MKPSPFAPLPILDQVKIASPCEMPWEDMKGDDRTRFCSHCSLHVHNLSAMTRAEAEAFLEKQTGRTCVRLYKRFDGTVLIQDCPVGLHAVRERLFRVTGALLATLFGLLVTAWGAKSLLAKPANNGNFTSSRFSLRDFSRRLRNTFYPRGEVVGEICVPPPPRATPRGAFVQGAVCVPPPPTPTLPTQNP